MSFFNGASDLTISNSHFSAIGGDFLNINLTTPELAASYLSQLLEKMRERDESELERHLSSGRNSDGLMIIKTDEIKWRTELVIGNNYRIHSASHGVQGRMIAVKVFEGSHAKQDYTKNVAFLKKFLHSNIPSIIGISDERSEVPFVVFHGVKNMIQPLIAKALRTDLNKSVVLSMKAVKGLAAGLNYIISHEISKTLTSIDGWEQNLNIFAGDNEEPIIAVHLPSTLCEDSFISHSSSNDHGMKILNGLCQKLFSEVNSVLYDDSPQRESSAQDIPMSLVEEVSEISIPEPPDSVKNIKLNRTPRREVRWRLDMSANNRSLDFIARRFGDYLDCFLSSPSESPLRRISASEDIHSKLRTSHRCPGYLREEITLTSEVSRSVIISHEYPSQSELCSVCGQLVQYSRKNPRPRNTLSKASQYLFGTNMPRYEYQSRGPQHNLIWTATIYVLDMEYGKGEGQSQQVAADNAATKALALLRSEYHKVSRR